MEPAQRLESRRSFPISGVGTAGHSVVTQGSLKSISVGPIDAACNKKLIEGLRHRTRRSYRSGRRDSSPNHGMTATLGNAALTFIWHWVV
jgi:hypothetical protein